MLQTTSSRRYGVWDYENMIDEMAEALIKSSEAGGKRRNRSL